MTCDAVIIWMRRLFSFWDVCCRGANNAQISVDKRQFRKIIIRFPILTVLKEYKMNLELIYIFKRNHPQTSIE